MRSVTLALLFFLATPALAQESLASRFPVGAVGYVEINGLHGKVDAALKSKLGLAIKNHPAVQKFLLSPEGAQFMFGEQMLMGATGLDYMGMLNAIAGKQIAIAAYGMPPKVVALTRMDKKTMDSLLAAAELMTRTARTEVRAATEQSPALYQLHTTHFFHDGDLLCIANDPLLAAAMHGGVAKGLDQNEKYQAARRLTGNDVTVFAMADLDVVGGDLRQFDKPKDMAQAFIMGAFAHYLPKAPWGAATIDFKLDGEAWKLRFEGFVPKPTEDKEAVVNAYGGTLQPMPLQLPASTVGYIRVRRSLQAMWQNQEALIAEAGLADLVKFETNFGNLTSGMSWVEELLPALGDEMIIIGTKPKYTGERTPSIHFPNGALLLPINGDDKLKLKLQVAWQNFISILNLQSAQMKGNALFSTNVEYKGVMIQTAKYAPPDEAELEGMKSLPPRYAFQPSSAMVGKHFVFASHIDIVKEIIDGYGEATPAPEGVNAGLWIKTDAAHELLVENREAIIARVMIEQGENRAMAETKVDNGLSFAKFLRSLEVTSRESRSAVGLRFDIGLQAPPIENGEK